MWPWAIVLLFYAFGIMVWGWPKTLGDYLFYAGAFLISFIVVRHNQKKSERSQPEKEHDGPGSD
jgi:hypothetical protein